MSSMQPAGNNNSTEIGRRTAKPLDAIKKDFLAEKFNSNGRHLLAGALAASVLGFLGVPLLPAAVAGAFVTGFRRYSSEGIEFWENAEVYGKWKTMRENFEMKGFTGSVASANHQVMDSLAVAAGVVAGVTVGIASAPGWFVAAGGAVLLGFAGFMAGKIASYVATPAALGVLTAAEFIVKDAPKRLLLGKQDRSLSQIPALEAEKVPSKMEPAAPR